MVHEVGCVMVWTEFNRREILGSHCCEYKDDCLL